MLKRHEIEILLKAGHPKTEVARFAGVSARSVHRIAEENPIVDVNDSTESSNEEDSSTSMDPPTGRGTFSSSRTYPVAPSPVAPRIPAPSRDPGTTLNSNRDRLGPALRHAGISGWRNRVVCLALSLEASRADRMKNSVRAGPLHILSQRAEADMCHDASRLNST